MPRRVDALAGERVVGLAGGEAHSIAITDEGAVFSFGAGGDGRLGHGELGISHLHPCIRVTSESATSSSRNF